MKSPGQLVWCFWSSIAQIRKRVAIHSSTFLLLWCTTESHKYLKWHEGEYMTVLSFCIEPFPFNDCCTSSAVFWLKRLHYPRMQHSRPAILCVIEITIKGSLARSPCFPASVKSKLELRHLKMQLTLLKEMPGDCMLFLLHGLCFSEDSSWEKYASCCHLWCQPWRKCSDNKILNRPIYLDQSDAKQVEGIMFSMQTCPALREWLLPGVVTMATSWIPLVLYLRTQSVLLHT